MKPVAMVSRDAESPVVHLQVTCDAPHLPEATELVAWAEAAVRESGCAVAASAELVLRVVDERESQQLNRDFRGNDRPTNVLSFPSDLESMPGLPAAVAPQLGDVVLCATVVTREAEAQGKQIADHWGHLVVHGTLHLLGFDHQNSDEADTMEALETRILGARGVKNPYESGPLC